MHTPELAVLDLTSRIGGYALAHLGVAGASGHGAWERLPLGDVAGALEISWYRPAAVADLKKMPAQPDALAILVGPGGFTLLPAILALAAVRSAPAVWFILLPNAVMEDMEISKFLRTHGRAGVHKYQLPNSDPQTLWFVLMEQLGKVPRVNDYFNEDRRSDDMSSNLKSSMDAAMTIDGAQAVALVDYRSGMCLAQAGGGMNLDLAAAGNTRVVQAKLKTMEALGIKRGIEDILITLADQYHLIRLVPNNDGLFLYLVLDKAKGNLALARYKLTDIERSLKV
ncbi:hypothetical protein [Acidovorax sp. LjRoot194]|uniref:hypothetical protein n=1 Tax=Acidovorax sp. LjRoot194 TaxID=3342280 RepID=UPI003F505F09